MIVAFAVGLLLSALNVRYRDVNQAITLLVSLWLFLSPVAYPVSAVPAAWLPLYAVNPMSAVIEGFRWCCSADRRRDRGADLGRGDGHSPSHRFDLLPEDRAAIRGCHMTVHQAIEVDRVSKRYALVSTTPREPSPRRQALCWAASGGGADGRRRSGRCVTSACRSR